MNNKKTILTAIFLYLTISVYCQTYTGTILDKTDEQPLPFVDVYFPDLDAGTITDENGVFKIEHFQQNKIHVQISYVGYQTIDKTIDISDKNGNVFYLEPNHIDIKEVIVTASTGKLQGENIVSIERRKISELQQAAPVSLAEAIGNIAGVEQNTTGAGIGKPVIRGLSGNRIVTYAQGIRIENQQWGSEHGLGVGGVGIENVEVIKGPASLLYGSDALGGVLYFIDERYAKHNTVETYMENKFLSNTLGSINNIGFKIHKNEFKWNVFGAYASHADYQVPGFNNVFNTRFDEKNIKTAFGFNTKNWISNIRYSYLQNNFGITEEAVYTKSFKRAFILPFQTIDDHSLSFENKLYAGDSKVDLVLGFSNNYRREFEDDKNNQALGLKLNTFTYNLKWSSPKYKDKFDFVFGSQGMRQANKNNGEEILIPDANTTDFGIFGLANISCEKLKLQAGIRADSRLVDTKKTLGPDNEFPALQKNYHGLTFSAGARYNLEKTKFRVNIASGFRAPNTSELLSDGVHEGTNRYEKGNPNLHNENAVQVDFSFEYKSEHFTFGISPFYNYIKNYIFLSPKNEMIDNNPVFGYLQKDAYLYGGEMGFHYHPHNLHWLHLESSFSTVYANDKNKKALPLIPQTNINSTISAEIYQETKIHLTKVFVQHVYKFKQNRNSVFETKTGDYNILNIGLNLEIETKNKPLEITLGVKNLFDKKYIDHLSRFKTLGIPNQGINFYIGTKIKLEKKLKE